MSPAAIGSGAVDFDAVSAGASVLPAPASSPRLGAGRPGDDEEQGE